jgi:hypothetical protein
MRAACDRASLPSLAFEFEEKMGTFESIKTQVETFVESILFFGPEENAPAGPGAGNAGPRPAAGGGR